MALAKQTKLFFLDLGMAETLSEEMTMDDIMHRGKVFSLNVDECGEPIQIAAQRYQTIRFPIETRCLLMTCDSYLPDGIDVSKKLQRLFWTQMGKLWVREADHANSCDVFASPLLVMEYSRNAKPFR